MNKQDYIKAGGKVWQKETHERVYLSAEVFNKIVDTNYGDKKTTNSISTVRQIS